MDVIFIACWLVFGVLLRHLQEMRLLTRGGELMLGCLVGEFSWPKMLDCNLTITMEFDGLPTFHILGKIAVLILHYCPRSHSTLPSVISPISPSVRQILESMQSLKAASSYSHSLLPPFHCLQIRIVVRLKVRLHIPGLS